MKPLERIPLHNHADGNSGGKIDPNATTEVVTSGGSGGTGGGGTTSSATLVVEEVGSVVVAAAGTLDAGHGLDVTDEGGGIAGLAVDETELTSFELNTEGGQSVIKAHGSMGSTETFDPTDGNVHTGTLDANCTFTLNAPTGSGAALLEIRATQDGTGGRTITWPGAVSWIGGTPSPVTTAGTTAIYLLESLDGGSTWSGVLVGGGPTGTVTSVALTVPTEFSVSGSPVTSSGTLAITKATETANTVWAGPTSGSAAQPTFRALVAGDIPFVTPSDHEHVMNLWFSGDGSTTAFELPAAPFDSQSVRVWVSGTLTDVTLSGSLLTTMTFGSAPASATNNIVVDLVAAVA
jgi:hypothetical protein